MLTFTRVSLPLAVLTSLASFASAGDTNEILTHSWHQWRGPHANGVASNAEPPLTWSETENLAWKVSIEGLGNSTPIIWGDKLFVLTTIDTGKVDPTLPKPEDQPERPFGITFPNTYHQYVVLCFDRLTGDELWRRVAIEKIPHEGHHGDNSFASCSPTTDGERLYVWFGSAGLYCYDLDGGLLWERDLGTVETRRSFGEGASPVVHHGRLIIVRDQELQSYIVVVDAKTGEDIWRKDRDEPSCWATPLVVEHEGRTQVITNGTNRVRSYDLADGTLIWECGGQVMNVTPSPVTQGDIVYCASGYRGSALQAISLDSQGDVTGSDQVLWSKDRGTPYIPSPLLVEGRLYFNQSNSGILSCLDAMTGEVMMERTRLPDVRNMYASPVAAEGRIYLVGRDGTTQVIENSKQLNVLATNKLNDRIDASPAMVGRRLYLRSKQNLYCLEQQ